MKNYAKKSKYFRRPVRIDFYPKTEEKIEDKKEVKVVSHTSPVCSQDEMTSSSETMRKGSLDNEIIKCTEYQVENIEIIEEPVVNPMGEFPKAEVENLEVDVEIMEE